MIIDYRCVLHDLCSEFQDSRSVVHLEKLVDAMIWVRRKDSIARVLENEHIQESHKHVE